MRLHPKGFRLAVAIARPFLHFMLVVFPAFGDIVKESNAVNSSFAGVGDRMSSPNTTASRVVAAFT